MHEKMVDVEQGLCVNSPQTNSHVGIGRCNMVQCGMYVPSPLHEKGLSEDGIET